MFAWPPNARRRPSPKSNLRLDQASLLRLASVGTGRTLASLLGLRQNRTGIKRARFHVLVCHGGNSLLLGLNALEVADSAPSQKPCPLVKGWGVGSFLLLRHQRRPSHIQPHRDAGRQERRAPSPKFFVAKMVVELGTVVQLLFWRKSAVILVPTGRFGGNGWPWPFFVLLASTGVSDV